MYVQVSWVGAQHLEVVVLGPNFVPDEVSKVLQSDDTYVVGVNVHTDLARLLGRKTGYKGVDLSVVTRDLPNADLERCGLGQLIKETTGVSVDHLKNPSKAKEWARFKGIRSHGWDKHPLPSKKVIYAAMDPALSIAVLYNYLQHWSETIKTADKLRGKCLSWQVILDESIGAMVDRAYHVKKKKFRNFFQKNLRTHEAAMELSRELYIED